MILAFDPGRDKTGFAFLNEDGNLLLSGIFHDRDSFFDALIHGHSLEDYITEQQIEIVPEIAEIKFIAIGNGTNSKDFVSCVRSKLETEIIITDERNTTLEARKLYWQIHKPSFFMRLLPETMRVPSRMLDDLAAWAIGKRAMKKYRDIAKNRL